MTNEDTRPESARRLQLAREASGHETAKGAARRYGWSEDTYAQHENGTRGLTRAAKRYARAFKVSEAWLLTGEGQGIGEHAAVIEILRSVAVGLPTDEDRRELARMAQVYALGAAERARLAKEKEGRQTEGGEQSK